MPPLYLIRTLDDLSEYSGYMRITLDLNPTCIDLIYMSISYLIIYNIITYLAWIYVIIYYFILFIAIIMSLVAYMYFLLIHGFPTYTHTHTILFYFVIIVDFYYVLDSFLVGFDTEIPPHTHQVLISRKICQSKILPSISKPTQ